MAPQAQLDIQDFLKKVKAAPIEEISAATALDVNETDELLQNMADQGLVDLQPSRKYPGEQIAIGTYKLFSDI